MFRFLLLLLWPLSWIAGCKSGADSLASILSVNLATLSHDNFSFEEIKKNSATVIIFLQPECPFCNSYTKTLRQLDSTFRANDVKLLGVMAGTNFSNQELQVFRDEHKLHFPMLLDPEFVLTKQLNATITPQAFLLDRQGNVLYHGMIDNWGYEIGKMRARTTEFYLLDAVDQLLNGKPVIPDSTKAIGCYIQ